MDQCPSSMKAKGIVQGEACEATAPAPAARTGRTTWRSLDELAGRAEFREFVEREFPAQASELLGESRRDFMKLMGASVALAGAASLVPGCRRPENPILTYNERPEEIIEGKPLFYATARLTPGGGAEGLLAETFEGRPTKLEGNPLHPGNNGKLTLAAQASVLDLYDPDRGPDVVREMAARRAKKKEGAKAFSPLSAAQAEALAKEVAAFGVTQGAGLAFLVDKVTSPARDMLQKRLMAKMPSASWHVWEPQDNEAAIAGSRIAFGGAYKTMPKLESAKVIVALDCDFMSRESDLRTLRGYAKGRITEGSGGHAAAGTQMSRVYAIEPSLSLTGGQADHRLPVRVAQVGAIALAIAKKLGVQGISGDADLHGISGAEDFVNALAADLQAHNGASAVLVGANQEPAVHALAHAINTALGNVGKTIDYVAVPESAATSSVESLGSLVRKIDAGQVETLVVIGCNPVFDAPADFDFAAKYARVAMTIHLGDANETAEMSTKHIGRSASLEAWSDAWDWDGAHSVIQPMIQPLYDNTMSDIEFLQLALGEARDGYLAVRQSIAGAAGTNVASPAFEKTWRRTLHDGVRPGSQGSNKSTPTRLNATAINQALGALNMASGQGLDVIFENDPHIDGGRNANNGWLQEAPHPITKCCWTNAALISPKTAKELGLNTNRHMVEPQYNHTQVIEISVGGKSAQCAMWVQPGVADGTIVLHCGQGRRVAGRIAEGTGWDVYPIRTSTTMRHATGATVARAKGKSPALIPNTQDHWTMEGRTELVREIDLPAGRQFGDTVELPEAEKEHIGRDAYGYLREGPTLMGMTFASRFGMEGHAPANASAYLTKQAHSYVEVERDARGRVVTDPDSGGPKIKRDAQGRPIGATNRFGRRRQQWGMSIDLNTCTGCGSCTVACQAENNIPVVGPKEVAKGREMHWIRVDRYFASDWQGSSDGVLSDPNPAMFTMPVPCQHCENAPCEVVCPVQATTHDVEGNNNMAYNRCIGTRYCNNNCPYKVRRFNFFDYATKQYKGGFGQLGEELKGDDALMPNNENLMPPRLRAKKFEVATMQYNPHVTVRSRGVMEKCTYCIQRVNAAKVEAKLHDLAFVPDGAFQTACQQACPTDAIVFGDIYDYASNNGAGSRVYQERNSQRTYALLGYLNVRPRTTYKMRVRNPNPALVSNERKATWADPFHHGGGGEHGASEHPPAQESHGGEHAMIDGDGRRLVRLPVLMGALS